MPEPTPSIKSISDKYWLEFERICDKWIEHARWTDRANRKNTETAIHELYEQYYLPHPVIIWCQSPWQMDLLAVTLETMLGCDAIWKSKDNILDRNANTRWQSFFLQLKKQFNEDCYSQLTKLSECTLTDFSPNLERASIKRRGPFTKGLLTMRIPLPQNQYPGVLSDCLELDLVAELMERLMRKLKVQDPEIPPHIFRPRLEDIRYLSSRILKTLTPGFLSSVKEDLGFGGVLWAGKRSRFELDEGLMRLFLEWRTQESRWSVHTFPAAAPVLEFLPLLAPEAPAVQKLSIWSRLALECDTCLFFQQACFICERPTSIHLDDSKRLHNANGAALEFADGFRHYAWHGTIVAKEAIETTELTIDKIHSENNVESRRVMVERFGVARYITESGATILDQDEYGVLYCQSIRGDEPILVLKVIDATAEPNGTFKEYFLRVPPQIMTAREAVAWTFQMSEEEYRPLIQT
jgi:hypothetical protein